MAVPIDSFIGSPRRRLIQRLLSEGLTITQILKLTGDVWRALDGSLWRFNQEGVAIKVA